VKALSKQKYASSYPMASIYATLGRKDEAFAWLERVYKNHSYYVVWLNIDRVFDGLTSDARFQDLLSRMASPHKAAKSQSRFACVDHSL
jgi:hypothetical protein